MGSFTSSQTQVAYDNSGKIGSTIRLASVSITSTGLTDASGTKQISVTFNTIAASTVDASTYVNFSGNVFQTVTIPSNATGCLIAPPAGNTTITLTLKGITGDTGVALSRNLPTLVTFDATTPPTSFGLTAGSTSLNPVICSFF